MEKTLFSVIVWELWIWWFDQTLRLLISSLFAVYCFITDLMICITYTSWYKYISLYIISWKLTNCSWKYEEIWHYIIFHWGPWFCCQQGQHLMKDFLNSILSRRPNDAIWKKTAAVVLEEVWNLLNGTWTFQRVPNGFKGCQLTIP